jgi:hypothetical protein
MLHGRSEFTGKRRMCGGYGMCKADAWTSILKFLMLTNNNEQSTTTTSSHVCAFSSLAARPFWTILEIPGAGRIVKTHTQSIRSRARSSRSFSFRLYRYTIHSYFFFQIWDRIRTIRYKPQSQINFARIFYLTTSKVLVFFGSSKPSARNY